MGHLKKREGVLRRRASGAEWGVDPRSQGRRVHVSNPTLVFGSGVRADVYRPTHVAHRQFWSWLGPGRDEVTTGPTGLVESPATTSRRRGRDEYRVGWGQKYPTGG